MLIPFVTHVFLVLFDDQLIHFNKPLPIQFKKFKYWFPSKIPKWGCPSTDSRMLWILAMIDYGYRHFNAEVKKLYIVSNISRKSHDSQALLQGVKLILMWWITGTTICSMPNRLQQYTHRAGLQHFICAYFLAKGEHLVSWFIRILPD